MSRSALTIRTDGSLWAQVLLLLLAGVSVLLHSVREVYLVNLCLLSLLGGWGLLQITRDASRTTLWDLMWISICLGYGLGSLNTELTWVRQTSDYALLTAASPLYLYRTVGWMSLLCAGLMAASTLDSTPVFSAIRIEARHHAVWAGLILAVAITASLLVAKGSIGYHQEMTDGGVSISPLAALTVSALVPAAALACFLLPQANGRVKTLLIVGFLLIALIQFYQGRRVFIYTVIVCLMCFSVGRSRSASWSWRQVLTLLVAAAAIMGASKAFFALRMAKWELGSAKDTVALIETGWGILMDAKRSGLNAELESNQRSRTFILGYPAELVQALEDHEPLYGQVVLLDVALNVPSVLWPGKYKVLSLGAEEAIANPHFGLELLDEANSILTTGLSDLGLAGLFVYPLVLMLSYRLVLAASRRLGSAAYLMVAAALVNAVLNVEAATADYFNVLRSVVLIAGLSTVAWLAWRLLSDPHRAAAV
ncbi:MAG: hypothetical protein KGI91_05560 [Burkholderiales bacterium]|nr:hypothetical protein [Burkholderiales bacterium]MDE2433737.1 hypothetical protein [Burkholderiales bacterium]